jgi:hypothetical protein
MGNAVGRPPISTPNSAGCDIRTPCASTSSPRLCSDPKRHDRPCRLPGASRSLVWIPCLIRSGGRHRKRPQRMAARRPGGGDHGRPGAANDPPMHGADIGFDTPARRLGALYVVEGSTLGGRHLARNLDPLLGSTESAGRRFFLGRGADTNAAWIGFLARMTLFAGTPADSRGNRRRCGGNIQSFSRSG